MFADFGGCEGYCFGDADFVVAAEFTCADQSVAAAAFCVQRVCVGMSRMCLADTDGVIYSVKKQDGGFRFAEFFDRPSAEQDLTSAVERDVQFVADGVRAAFEFFPVSDHRFLINRIENNRNIGT